MSKCIHANKLHDNLWCSTACMYCTLSQEEMCRHRKDVPETNVVKTNADHIRSMTDEELAKRNVRKIKTPVTGCYDYGESYTDYYDAFETSDGSIFWTEKPAVEYELNWLKQPYKEDA